MKYLLVIVISFATPVRADVCDWNWWEMAELPDLDNLILNDEAFPELCGTQRYTPLHWAAAACQNPEVLLAFMELTNADPLASSIPQATPLSLARQRLNIAKALTESAENKLSRVTQRNSDPHKPTTNNLPDQTKIQEAQEQLDQAINTERIAEEIYQILLLKSQQ